MNIIVIDPTTKRIETRLVPSYAVLKEQVLGGTIGATYISDTQMLLYQPFISGPDARYFFSHKLEQHYAGVAAVVGATVDGHPMSVGRGMLEAMKEDILFLGNVEQAKNTVTRMAKFGAGTMKAHRTLQ